MLAPTLLLVLTAAPAVAAPTAVPNIDFDQGVDVSALLRQAKSRAKEDASVVKTSHVSPLRYQPDCATITFGPDGRTVSAPIRLESVEWIEDCPGGYYPYPYPPYPNRPGDPYYGDPRWPAPGDPRSPNCYPRPGYRYSRNVRVTLRERQPLLPWEYDSFRVCLTGQWLDIETDEAAYDYAIVRGGDDSGDFLMAPVKKVPMKPDPAGVTAEISGGLVLTFKDKWASYYAGERTVLKFSVKKENAYWFDETVIEKEIELPTAGSYSVDVNAFASEFMTKPQAGKNYYAKYQVKRVGRISKPVFTEALETNKAVYSPAVL